MRSGIKQSPNEKEVEKEINKAITELEKMKKNDDKTYVLMTKDGFKATATPGEIITMITASLGKLIKEGILDEETVKQIPIVAIGTANGKLKKIENKLKELMKEIENIGE